mgnify:CR=1 FL=1
MKNLFLLMVATLAWGASQAQNCGGNNNYQTNTYTQAYTSTYIQPQMTHPYHIYDGYNNPYLPNYTPQYQNSQYGYNQSYQTQSTSVRIGRAIGELFGAAINHTQQQLRYCNHCHQRHSRRLKCHR